MDKRPVSFFRARLLPFAELILCLLLLAGIVLVREAGAPQELSPEGQAASVPQSAISDAGAPQELSPEGQAASVPQSVISDAGAPLSGQFCVYPSARAGVSSADASPVFLWQEDGGALYLFLPSYAEHVTLSFGQSGAGRLDGTLRQTGDTLSLTPGTHTLSPASGGGDVSFLVLRSSGLPALYTRTGTGSLQALSVSKERTASGTALLIGADGVPLYEGALAELSGHGNSSWLAAEKRSWQIKLPEKTDLCGMGAARDWLLVSNAFDPSLLRNALTYHLAQEAGLAFTPDCRYVDWYADGIYQGTYLLCEKIETGKNRVDIADLASDTRAVNPEGFLHPATVGTENERGSYKGFAGLRNPGDITGGYLFSLELNTETEPRYRAETSGFVTNRGQAVVIKRPAQATLEQAAYLRDLYQKMEDAICDESGFNPETGFYYTHYLDVDSFARKYIIEELSKNMDAQYSSQYFYKDADTVSSRIFAGPVWDYDRAWGCSGTRVGVDLSDPETFYANQPTYEGTPWYHLYRQETFRSFVLRTFRSICPALSETFSSDLQALPALLADSALMNDYRWQITPGASEAERRAAYQEACRQVNDFGTRRLAFLQREWGAQP